MISYLIAIRPFTTTKKNVFEVFNESCILCSELVIIALRTINMDEVEHDDRKIFIGWAFLGIILLNMLVNMTKALIESLMDVIKKCKKSCCSKKSK